MHTIGEENEHCAWGTWISIASKTNPCLGPFRSVEAPPVVVLDCRQDPCQSFCLLSSKPDCDALKFDIVALGLVESQGMAQMVEVEVED